MARTKKNSPAAELPGLAEATGAGLKPIEKFHNSLALSRWALKILKGHSLDSFRGPLNKRELEGVDAGNGHTRFFNAAIGSSLFELGDGAKVTKSALRRTISISSRIGPRSPLARTAAILTAIR